MANLVSTDFNMYVSKASLVEIEGNWKRSG